MAFCQCFLHKDVNRNVVFLRYWMLMNIYWISIFLSIFFKRTKSTFDPSLMLRTSFCCVTLYGSVSFSSIFFSFYFIIYFQWHFCLCGVSLNCDIIMKAEVILVVRHLIGMYLFFFSICASKLTSSCVWLWTFSFNPAPQMGWEVRGSLKWGL